MLRAIVVSVLGTISKDLLKVLEELETEGRAETIQTTALVYRPEYREKSWRLKGTCCLSESWERPDNVGVKNSQEMIIKK